MSHQITLEENLGYKFKKKTLLDRALTRKAYALELHQQNKECEDQEIYRTLGDAVLKAVLIDLLIKSGCNTRGDITSRKKSLEREEGLAEISKSIGVGSFLKLGMGEEKQKAQEEPYVLAETLEAIIGAVYLDGGFDASKRTIEKLFEQTFI
jgi:ribonuclease III